MIESPKAPSDWQHLGGNIYVSPPGPQNGALQTYAGPLVTVLAVPKSKGRWKKSVLAAAGMTALATIIAAFIQTTRTPPNPEAPRPAIDCSQAQSHFNAASKIADAFGRRMALEDHLRRFPSCTFATLAQIMLAALSPPSKPRDDINRPAEMPPGPNDSAELPPIVVSPLNTAVLNIRVGPIYEFQPGINYRIQPTVGYTTNIEILRGSLTLILDGKVKFSCYSGSFRLFTRGASRFEFVACALRTAVTVPELTRGDLISQSL